MLIELEKMEFENALNEPLSHWESKWICNINTIEHFKKF